MKTAGHLHIVREGVLTVCCRNRPHLVINEPTALLNLRPGQHTFQSGQADIVSAFVEFGAGMSGPLNSGLPDLLRVPLASVPELAPTVELLFKEAFSHQHGRQAAVDRLAEYFLVLLLRSAIDSQILESGVLTALADNRLSKAMASMHDEPERQWSLDELAQISGMSRARFAAHFLATTGQTPFQYLTRWRVGVAQSMLKKGEPLKIVAPFVGYGSSGALTRAFSKCIGLTPVEWLAAQQHILM